MFPHQGTPSCFLDVYHTYLLLQSEFLRRLSLCFCPDLWLKGSKLQLELVTEVTSSLSLQCGDILKELNRDYKLFSSYGTSEDKSSEDDANSKKKETEKKECLKYVDTFVAIHSAGLHLQSLLLGVRSLEEILEKEDKNESGTDEEDSKEKANNKARLQEIEDHLTKLLVELLSCRDCFEEALLQITKLKSPSNEVTTSLPSTPVEEKKNEDKVKSPIPIGFSDLDPDVKDEIFEAYITRDICDSDGESDYVVMTPEEKLKKKEEKEHSRRLLQELKVVLIEKARQWKEREAKAVHKVTNKKKKSISEPEKDNLPKKQEVINCLTDANVPLERPAIRVNKLESVSDLLHEKKNVKLPNQTVNLTKSSKNQFSLEYNLAESFEAQTESTLSEISRNDIPNSISSGPNSGLCNDSSNKNSVQYASDTSSNINFSTDNKVKPGNKSSDDSIELPLGIDCLENSPLWPLPRFKRPAPKHRSAKNISHLRHIRAAQTPDLEEYPTPGFESNLALQAVAKFRLLNAQKGVETFIGTGEDSDSELVEDENSKDIS